MAHQINRTSGLGAWVLICERWYERLEYPLWSSGGFGPGSGIAEEGFGEDDALPPQRPGRHLRWLACVDEAEVNGLEIRVVAGRDAGRPEQGPAARQRGVATLRQLKAATLRAPAIGRRR